MQRRILDILRTAIVMICASSPAMAIDCKFTTECFESEACSDTSYDVSIEENDGKTALITVSETVPVSLGGSDVMRVYVGVTDGAFHLLSRAADGTARYTNHLFQGPMVVSYLGKCEDPS